jgi:hypothetical protein
MKKDDLQLVVCGTRQLQSLLLLLDRRPRKVRGFGGAAMGTLKGTGVDDDDGEGIWWERTPYDIVAG